MRRRLSRAADSPLRRWRRLILGLLGALLAVQAATLALFAIGAWRTGESRSRAFVDQAVSAASLAAAEQVAGVVRDFETSVNVAVELTTRGVVSGTMDDETERYLLAQLRARPAVSAVYVGFGDGAFLMASRDSSKEGYQYRVKRVQTDGGRVVSLTWLDGGLRRGPTERVADDTFDPRERPWYRTALSNDGVVWTDPYIFFTSRQPGMTVARRARDRGGLARVYGVDFSVERLGAFARQMRVGPNGNTLIVAGDGSVIAAPGLESRIIEDADGRSVLPKLTAFSAPVPDLAPVMRSARAGVARTNVVVGDTAVAITKVPVGAGTWTVAMYGPMSDFGASAERSERRDLLNVVLLGSAALLLALGLAAALTRPLGGLATTAASDGLTGLLNRRELESLGTVLVDRAVRGGRMLSTIIIDIDAFKTINDTHGHLVGDDVLRGVAEVLRSVVRRDDIVARFAGDEFVVVMPDAGGPEADSIAERAVAAIRGIAIPEGTVSASAGVATLTRQHGTLLQVLEAADRALYRAKGVGRDRVVRAWDVVAQDPEV